MELDVPSQQTEAYSEQDQQILEGNEAQENQEELIGGKFKTPDDLLKAYQELEKKFSTGESKQDSPKEEASQEEEATPEEQPSSATLTQQDEETLLESIGGKDNLSAAGSWARDNLNPSEIDSYNKEVNSGDFTRARNAMQSLMFAFQNAADKEPSLLSGSISNKATDVFRSTSEVEAAMNDPRYLEDTAYTKDVEEKMYRSDILSPR